MAFDPDTPLNELVELNIRYGMNSSDERVRIASARLGVALAKQLGPGGDSVCNPTILKLMDLLNTLEGRFEGVNDFPGLVEMMKAHCPNCTRLGPVREPELIDLEEKGEVTEGEWLSEVKRHAER